MAEKPEKSVEEVILAIERHLVEIDATLVKYAAERAEDLKAIQHSFELLKADLDDIRGQLNTVNERLKRLEARNR